MAEHEERELRHRIEQHDKIAEGEHQRNQPTPPPIARGPPGGP